MKIKFKLSLIFLMAGFILITVLFFIYIVNVRREFINQIENQLESVAEAKLIDINQFMDRRFYLIEFISDTDFLKKSMWKESRLTPDFKGALVSLKEKFATVNEINILDSSGKFVYSTNPDKKKIGDTAGEAFLAAKQHKSYISEFSYNTEKDKLSFFISTAIEDSGVFLGVVYAKMDASELLETTDDYTGLGKSGETIIGKRTDVGVVAITPLRYSKSSALKKLKISDIPESPLNKAVNGVQGVFKGLTDYRGKRVIVATRYVDSVGWGIVTKIDEDEALAPVRRLSQLLIILNLLLVLLLIIPAYFMGSYFAKPIEKLTETAQKINNGELSERASIKSDDEIGMLAKSFNEMTDKLQNKIKELDRYAYVISHDLKAPLSSIMPLASFIKDDYKDKPLDKEGNEMIEMIMEKSSDMKKLIDGVLESARTENKMREPVKVYDLVKDVVKNLNPPSSIKVNISENVSHTVHYHKVSLIQIFLNLISNAIKYMDKANGLISIDCVREGSYFKFSVTDNGRGIEEENLETLFEQFSVAHNDPRISSSGLGLSIVKKIVEENGGTIGVKSSLGMGSVFYFTVKA